MATFWCKSGGLRPGSDRVELLQAKGSRQRLAIKSAGGQSSSYPLEEG